MFFKKFFSKNLIAIFILVVSGAFIVGPNFLSSHKTLTKPQNQLANSKVSTSTTAVTTQNSPTTQVNGETQTSSHYQVQGAITQQTPATKKPAPVAVPAPKPIPNPTPQPTPTPSPTPVTQTVTVNINTGSANYSYKVSWTTGLSVYDVLVKASKDNNFAIKSSWYGAPLNSYYVTGIAGKVCECWTYKANGVSPALGASRVTVKANDIISWKAN